MSKLILLLFHMLLASGGEELSWSVSHPFYEKLNRLLVEHGLTILSESGAIMARDLLFYLLKPL